MKLIPLSNGGCTLVDNDIYEWACWIRWHRDMNGYIVASNGELLHRLVMNVPKGMETDHKEHRLWDNRRESLRVCTQSQNMMNQTVQTSCESKPKSSKYKGVCWDKRKKKWKAYITTDDEQIYLAYFVIETDAALAYNEAAILYFGEFACLNAIDKEESVA